MQVFPKIVVLMYHRIDNTNTDPWGICVSPPHFEEQINFLKGNYNVIRVAEVMRQVKNKNITANSVCITFDDGYADNYSQAKRILEEKDCPATFFISTAFINEKIPFWWEELELILLHSTKLPKNLTLDFAEESYQYTFNEDLSEEEWILHTQWKWFEQPPTKRCASFLAIWHRLRGLAYEEIKYHLAAIRSWAAITPGYYNERMPLSAKQLSHISKNKLFTIGLHTHTHADLQVKEKQVQAREISRSKDILLTEYNIESNCLAYPYGRYNSDTIEVVKELQLQGCFTTHAASVCAKDDITMLGRHQVFDWDIKTFKDKLDTWFNL